MPPAATAQPTAPAVQSAKTGLVATISVPRAGIRDLKIIRYRGVPDDTYGTGIQDTGVAVAPFGDWGGVLPGQIGNFMVTAHRTSHGSPMLNVPELEPGDIITVKSAGMTYRYKVADELWVDFRREADRISQRSPVPGHPGRTATAAAITLSTCATPEDHAAGLYWSDSNGNPAHRIAITAFLVP